VTLFLKEIQLTVPDKMEVGDNLTINEIEVFREM
jgi:hypothetical protein